MEEVLVSFAGIVVSALGTIIFMYVNKIKYIQENKWAAELAEQAIYKAEQIAIVQAKIGARKVSGSEKMAIAKSYIEKVDPAVYNKMFSKLEDLIESKLGKKNT